MKLERIFQNIFYPFQENEYNRVFEKDFNLEDHTPIYVFFHIYAANHWKAIVDELMGCLKSNGLYERMNHLYVTVISNNDGDIEYIRNQIGNKGSIEYVTSNPKEFEFPALELLYSLSKDNKQFYSLYFHTKGSSNSIKTLKHYKFKAHSLDKLLRLSSSARRFMAYWNITRWKCAISALQNGYSTYGCNYCHISNNTQFYGGNFWWAKSSYVKTRSPFDNKKKDSRYYAEGWLLENTSAKIYNAYRINSGANGIEIPFDMYGGHGVKKLYGIIVAYKNHIIYSIKKVYKRLH